MSLDNSTFYDQTVRLDSLKVSQLVAIFGDGKLRDGNECGARFRAFLRTAPLGRLSDYVKTCLDSPFNDSGLALQDLINELGRRLDFEVEDGLYQGRTNAIGFDGLWRSPAGNDLIIEVKTTDTYRISLDKIAGYRNELIRDGRARENSSCLMVVGREDTGELEAQVRGSRHAWTIRIISADSLLRLVQLKENADEETASKTREILIPIEFTRLDRIIDLAFIATSETVEGVNEEPLEIPTSFESGERVESEILHFQNHTPHDAQELIRVGIANALRQRFGKELVRKSRAAYWTLDKEERAIISLSKHYPDDWYWYGYHAAWDDFLREGKTGILALGCVGENHFYALPFDFIHPLVQYLNISPKPDSDDVKHWHIHLKEIGGKMQMKLHKLDSFQSIQEFKVTLGTSE